MDQNFDIQGYMTRGVERVVADAIKATVRIDGGRLALNDVDYEALKNLPVFDKVRKKKDLFDTAPRQLKGDK